MYDHITTLEQQFIGKQLAELPTDLSVAGITYHISDTNNPGFRDLASGAKKGYVSYAMDRAPNNVAAFKKAHTNTDDKQSVQDSIILAWAKANESMALMPVAARFISRNRIMNAVSRGIYESDTSEIGLSPEAIVIGINGNNPIQAKTDTGADMCSLHADSVNVKDGTVLFTIGGSSFSLPLVKTLNVKQADSSGESRPVIKCAISVNGTTVRDVECNLNNRDGMVPLLLGKNFLQQGGFAIKVEDVVDWDAVDALFEDVEIPSIQQDNQYMETLMAIRDIVSVIPTTPKDNEDES